MQRLRPVLIALALLALVGCQADTAPRNGTVASADGVSIAYTVAGQGPAVVLVHCWSGNRSLFDSAQADLVVDHRVLTLDLAGHGESGGERTDYTMTAFARDVLAAMDVAAVDRAVLVGHSMGGTVMMEVAHLAPERVLGLVGIDNLQQVEQIFTREQLDLFMAPMRGDFAAFVRPFVRGMFPADADSAGVARVTDIMLQADPAVATSAFANLFDYDMPTAARAYEGSVRLVNDPVYPVNVDQWREYGVDLAVAWLEGVGHFPMVSAPDRFLPELRKAVVELEAVASP